jgi:hypothetical protein
VKLHQQSLDQSRAVVSLFEELSKELSDCDASVSAGEKCNSATISSILIVSYRIVWNVELKVAAEWQSQLSDYWASLAHSVDAFAKKSKQFVDKDYAETKKVADAYDKKRNAFNAADQKFAKLLKNPASVPDLVKDAERERADAKTAFDAAEAETLAQWQSFAGNGADLIRSCLSAYLKDYATFHKQGHNFFDVKRTAQEGVFSADARTAAAAAAISPRRQTAPATGTMSTRDLSAAVAANKALPTPSPASPTPTKEINRSSLGAASAGSHSSTSSSSTTTAAQDDDIDLLDKLTSTIDSAEVSLAATNAPAAAATASRPRQFAGARPAMPGIDLTAAVTRRPSVQGGMNAPAPGAPTSPSAGGAAVAPPRPTRPVAAAGAAQPRTQYQSLPSAPKQQPQAMPAKPTAAPAAQPARAAAETDVADALADLDDFLDGAGLEELAPLDEEF